MFYLDHWNGLNLIDSILLKPTQKFIVKALESVFIWTLNENDWENLPVLQRNLWWRFDQRSYRNQSLGIAQQFYSSYKKSILRKRRRNSMQGMWGDIWKCIWPENSSKYCPSSLQVYLWKMWSAVSIRKFTQFAYKNSAFKSGWDAKLI